MVVQRGAAQPSTSREETTTQRRLARLQRRRTLRAQAEGGALH
jgi:hypothetical protein